MSHMQQSAKTYLNSPRTRFLLGFWNQLRAEKHLPQLDRWLAQKFKADRRLGKKDRHWYSNALFSAMRSGVWVYHQEQAWQQSKTCLTAEVPESARSLWGRLRDLPGERLFLWLSLKDFADHPWCLEQPEEAWLRQNSFRQDPEADARLRAGVAPEWEAALQQRLVTSNWTDEQARTFLSLQEQRARVWLRGDERELLDIAKSCSGGDQLPLIQKPGALGLPPDTRLSEGVLAVELQDWASQCIGAALPLEGADWVWDACAGGGGKTLQIAARMKGKGKILASDIRAHKLEDLQKRAQMRGYSNIHTAWWDGHTYPQFPADVKKNRGFAAVLVDAPCSSSGTWRRSPDARYRLDEKNLEELLTLQAQLLHNAAAQVRPGGWLCYATCSWLVAENEAQVESFISKNREYSLVAQELCGAPDEDADTMYWALIQRKELGR